MSVLEDHSGLEAIPNTTMATTVAHEHTDEREEMVERFCVNAVLDRKFKQNKGKWLITICDYE